MPDDLVDVGERLLVGKELVDVLDEIKVGLVERVVAGQNGRDRLLHIGRKHLLNKQHVFFVLEKIVVHSFLLFVSSLLANYNCLFVCLLLKQVACELCSMLICNYTHIYP